MINTGVWKASFDNDGWTARTEDGGLSAQFEHTIGITADGAEVFTAN
jgi:methionyl aminopeptidase